MSDQNNTGQGQSQEARRLEDELETLVMDNQHFQHIEREFDQFCPFEALGIVRAEVRHGTFLAYLLDPFRPHKFGSKVLRILLLAAARAARDIGASDGSLASLTPLEIHLLDLDDGDVRRHWRDIDLVIVLDRAKIVIAIELKIESSQSDGQLARYRSKIEETWASDWRHLYIFLTKYDEEPKDSEFWIPVRLHQLVRQLEALADSPGADPTASGMLVAYLNMLKRHHMPNERLEEIARKLWAEHGGALAFLADRRQDALASVFSELQREKEAIAQKVSEAPKRIVVFDSETPKIIRFAFKNWDEIPGFRTSSWTDSHRLILMELNREGDCVYGVLYLGPGTTEHRQKYSDYLKDKRLHRLHSRPGRDWMCLAKSALYVPQQNKEFNAESALKNIRSGFEKFVQKVESHFDKLMKEEAFLCSLSSLKVTS